MMRELRLLVEEDNLREISVFDKKGFIHTDHRFTLPIVLYAQRNRLLPQPCDVILFDNHHDCNLPTNIQDLQNIDLDKISVSDFAVFCERNLSQLNDDWVISGLELGIFRNVTIFGVTENFNSPRHITENTYTDTNGLEHRVFINSSHLGPMLTSQDNLNGMAKCHARYCWETIGWQKNVGEPFRFSEDKKPFLLDIDLDCFSIYWSDFVFPWFEEVYLKHYYKVSNYVTTRGLTGKHVFQDIVYNSGFITIAEEPNFCGGIEKSNKVLADVTKFLFDNKLEVLSG